MRRSGPQIACPQSGYGFDYLPRRTARPSRDRWCGSLAKQGSKHARATVSQASMDGSAVLIRVPVPPHPLEAQQGASPVVVRQPAAGTRHRPLDREFRAHGQPLIARATLGRTASTLSSPASRSPLGLNDLPIPLDMFSAADLRFDPVVRYAPSLRALLRQVWLRTRGRRATAAARGRLWLRLKRALPLGNGRDRH